MLRGSSTTHLVRPYRGELPFVKAETVHGSYAGAVEDSERGWWPSSASLEANDRKPSSVELARAQLAAAEAVTSQSARHVHLPLMDMDVNMVP